MYKINIKLQELFAYGESVASKNNFTEEDVMEEIKNYRNNQLNWDYK